MDDRCHSDPRESGRSRRTDRDRLRAQQAKAPKRCSHLAI